MERCPKCEQAPAPEGEDSCIVCGYRMPDPAGQRIVSSEKRRNRRKKDPSHAGVNL